MAPRRCTDESTPRAGSKGGWRRADRLACGRKGADGGRNGGTMPRVTAGASTNSMKGATQTALSTIDTLPGSFNLQAPPHDGVQQSRASLGMSLSPSTAFDILADGDGGNRGFVLAGGTLHRLDIQTGALGVVGPVANLPGEIIDIAAMR